MPCTTAPPAKPRRAARASTCKGLKSPDNAANAAWSSEVKMRLGVDTVNASSGFPGQWQLSELLAQQAIAIGVVVLAVFVYFLARDALFLALKQAAHQHHQILRDAAAINSIQIQCIESVVKQKLAGFGKNSDILRFAITDDGGKLSVTIDGINLIQANDADERTPFDATDSQLNLVVRACTFCSQNATCDSRVVGK